jgi:hypothetical protein
VGYQIPGRLEVGKVEVIDLKPFRDEGVHDSSLFRLNVDIWGSPREVVWIKSINNLAELSTRTHFDRRAALREGLTSSVVESPLSDACLAMSMLRTPMPAVPERERPERRPQAYPHCRIKDHALDPGGAAWLCYG